ncbi:benzil reductase ((S)-benzoin forming) [Desulfosarcina alkanivorans]|jgi:benzil reductase ((S)-benzoin forming)|uniref:Benzil reductase ((S)-benzoin forming) n=1 Tax=Desulfosarcina alkanivorans TaxID=571177 RepID=A0A5K7Z0G8_9BACT|nr:SDR family NAD(P)-dependent oxidoreductase [Desulfosarcina alkanivorans]BBO71984.1 benzil reductase ((S)-benzoin forming) [Desulfosarcina alkanivorans]
MAQDPLEHLFFITGTTRGLGKALASSALHLPNSFVVSLSRAAPFLWNNHQNICIDLNDAGGIGPAFKGIHLAGQRTGRLRHTVLINNAGVLEPIAPIGDCDDALLARNIQVNLIAPLILSRHFFHFSRSLPGRKWIVNITSGASRSPYYGWSAYGAGKAGLDMATRAMALEFSSIDPAFAACAVAPGTVDTAMQEKIRACSSGQFEQVDKFLRLKARGGLASPGRVAATLVRLLVDGRFTNGGRYDLRKME